MPMKVTVCFDKVKVLVPCGDGELLVRELIEKAIVRYKKAIGKPTNYWVSVHTLRTVSEDSILDSDDTLSDVVDDREQLIADFQEQDGARYHHNGGDGQSVSSEDTVSHEIFETEVTNKDHHRGYSFDSNNDVIVTENDTTSGTGLTVRWGSEPTLVIAGKTDEPPLTNGHTSDHSTGHSSGQPPDNAASATKDDISSPKNDAHKPIIKSALAQKEKEKTPPFTRFARDSWRQSLGNQPNMLKWFEAQERQEDRLRDAQGPVEGSSNPVQGGITSEKPDKPPLPAPVKPKEVSILICLPNDGTALGIHVVPDFTDDGKETGLLVQGIESEGRIFRDGRLKVQDKIIEINGNDLHGITFPKAQEIFRQAMKTEEVRLKVVKHSVPPLPKKPPPAVLPKPRGHSPVKPSPLSLVPQSLDFSSSQSSPDQTSTPLENSDNASSDKPSSGSKKNLITSSPIKPVSPVKKAPPPAPPTRHPSTTLSTGSADGKKECGENEKDVKPTSTPTGTLTKNRENIIAPTNTKKIGKVVNVELVKGPMGLGFSITTRDNTTGSPSPIYIKNILPKGAAVTDGRLKAGDRLLEVNDEEMTGKTQTEAVAILRNMPLGAMVKIAVSRQEADEFERFKLPRELPLEKSGDDGTLACMKNKELMEFNIPTNETGTAGLGVSVKGKTLTTEEGTRDLGIFVKAVIHGGAASKDGRLQVNDQLLEVNAMSLVNHSNIESMELLRRAMQEEEIIPGFINIKVARRIGAPSPTPFTSPGSQEQMDISGELNNNVSFDKDDHISKDGEDVRTSPVPTKNGDVKSHNLFLDRVMAGNGLRNISYTRATHESMAETPEPVRNKSHLIDMTKQRPRPHSTLGIERGSPTGSNSSDSEDHKEPAWLHGPDWTRHASQTSDDSELQSPLPADGFSRDAFGRQSMSEKRKGHNDPRSSEIYQKVKGLKELNKDKRVYQPQRAASFHATGFATGLQRSIQQTGSYARLVRAGSAESLLGRSNSNVARAARDRHDKSGIRGPGPPSNLKRFSSLENLTTMQDPEGDTSNSFTDDDTGGQLPRMARKRGGNESFRAAVDRSYDPVPHQPDMDPQGGEKDVSSGMRRSRSVEEESSEGGSVGRDPLNSARSSVSDQMSKDDSHAHKKKDGKKLKEHRKSGGGLFGFLFNKGRKTPVEDLTKGGHSREDGNRDGQDGRSSVDQETRQKQMNLKRAEEQFRRLQEQAVLDQQHQYQQQQQQQQQQIYQGQGYTVYPYNPPLPEPHSMGHSAPTLGHNRPDGEPMSRAEKIQQLRLDHQRRHQERHGHYPQEDREEEYERMIQEEELRKYGQSAIPSQNEGQRSRPQSRNQVERPSSRLGPSEGTLHNYQDYSEIQKPGPRHVSDSNLNNPYMRPSSRGPVPVVDPNYYPQSAGPYRGQGPMYSYQPGQQRGPTPSHEHEGFVKYNSTSNANMNAYHHPHRGHTPVNVNDRGQTALNMNDNRYYGEESHMVGRPHLQQQGYNGRDHNVIQRPEVLPPGGQHYGNSDMAYRDPVYTSMAGKRPVKSLSSQPTSAKV